MAQDPPWLRFYGDVPRTLAYPETTLYQAVAEAARSGPDRIAWDFLGAASDYRRLILEIDRAALAFSRLGLRPLDRILVSMPTSPQGVIALYAANRLGALPAFIHPLSAAPEITHYLDATGARIAVVLDAFYGTMAAATPKIPLATIVTTRIPDYLPFLTGIGFWLTRGRKIPPIPPDPRVRRWSELMKAETGDPPPPARSAPDDPAVILFSGGTTGSPKGIVLSNRNLVAQSRQVAAWGRVRDGDSILAILPLFHGFGLAVCVNAALMAGGKTILVPQFSAPLVARLLRTRRPSVMVGVPTLFDALSKDKTLRRADLSCLRACFSGADTLPRKVKERFEALVRERGGTVRLLEGYGLTEGVAGVMATPLTEYREGSVGVPLPDTRAAIYPDGSDTEAPVGEEGEICVSGPTVMLGYLDDPETTARALRVHKDGRTWLHTGDLGRMDADGFFYFTGRLKRMIKSSGFNVYPTQVEAVLCLHPLVAEACVIGVPDEAQVERVKACVVLREPDGATRETEEALIAWCRERLIKWSCPREIEFRGSLPQTRVGKIDYRALVAEHVARQEKDRVPA